VSELYPYTLAGRGEMSALTTVAAAPVIAARLAPGHPLTLRAVPLTFRGRPPDRLAIEVVIARDLRLGGHGLGELLSTERRADSGASVDAGPLADHAPSWRCSAGIPIRPRRSTSSVLRRRAARSRFRGDPVHDGDSIGAGWRAWSSVTGEVVAP
jgi:hypothetical protein